jgi:menaquinone-dependent protoporphyrinogen IX oxidase
MPNERGWIDYAGLASQIGQNLQLSALHSTLAEIGDMALAKARRDLSEVQSHQIEAAARESTFQCQRMLKRLRGYLSENPRAVLALTLVMQAEVRANNLTTAVFTSFHDKDRLQEVLDDLAGLIREAEERLSPEDRRRVHLCMRYRAEEAELEQVAQLRHEWDRFEPALEEFEARTKEFEIRAESQNQKNFGGGLLFFSECAS